MQNSSIRTKEFFCKESWSWRRCAANGSARARRRPRGGLDVYKRQGFGTLPSQVAGFHRAVPSATLDKDSVVSPYKHIYYTWFSAKVNGFCRLFQNILSILFYSVHSLTIDFSAPFLYHTDIRSKGVFYIMKELRKRFDRFCLKNRNKGIPNLMMVIGIGNVIT